jgi:hypothetical protein
MDTTIESSTTFTDPEVLAESGLDKPAEKPAATTPADKKDRRGNGALETQIKAVTDAYTQSKIDIGDVPLTPYRIAKLVDDRFGGDTKTSTGAVTECLKRWRDYGFAVLASGDNTPMAFDHYTDDARQYGLKALKERYRAANKAAKAEAKATAKAASVAEAEKIAAEKRSAAASGVEPGAAPPPYTDDEWEDSDGVPTTAV